MLAATVVLAVLSERVVYETWPPELPEKATDGMPSKADSDAAPLLRKRYKFMGQRCDG